MQTTNLLDSVQYVTDPQGIKKSVLLDIDVWLKLVQQTQPKAVADYIHRQIEGKEELQTQRELDMDREEAAFHNLHPSLYQEYAGKYVAIHNEQLIDTDSDQVALYRRTRKQYPNQFVWIAPVNESPKEVLVFRSPRFLRNVS